jgi:hypothetical protein
VFGAPDDNIERLSEEVRAIRIRPLIRVARCATLRSVGFEVSPTFPNPRHFSVVLPNAARATFAKLRDCFGNPTPNPGQP